MSKKQHGQSEVPPQLKWWQKILFRMLAAGKYSDEWLLEVMELYEVVLREEGEKAADDWVLQELSLSVKFSIALRIYRILRIAYLMGKAYRKAAED